MIIHFSLSSHLYNIPRPELFSKYLGDTERTIRKLFARARKLAPCIVFFDELDAIGGKRGTGADDGESGVSERVLTQLLTEMDGIADKKKVTVIGCTNRPDLLDSALLRPGRLDAHIYVPLPDKTTRKDIVHVHSMKLALDPAIDLDDFAEKLEGYTGADIVSVLR